jgi:hypothetical protein
MLPDLIRLVTTLGIWGAFTMVAIFGRPANVSELNAVIMMGVLAFSAFLSTAAVWRGPGETRRERFARRMGKAKRSDHDRLARLADTLDENEAQVLLDALQTRWDLDSGDQVSLEALLQERDVERRM